VTYAVPVRANSGPRCRSGNVAVVFFWLPTESNARFAWSWYASRIVIELRLVQQAIALGRVRNFARAAEALHVAQPTLSRNIAALEKQVGVPLFDRDRKGIRPTAFGKLFLERGADLLRGEADLQREIQLLAGLETGTLTIGAGPYPTEISIGTAVMRLLRAHPELKVEVISEEPEGIAQKVLTGEFDVGIADARVLGRIPRLEVEPLPPHPVYFGCRPGHPLVTAADLTVETVLKYPLVSSLFFGDAAATAAEHGARGRVDLKTGAFAPAIHVNSLALALRIAQECDALFPGTAAMLAPEVEAGRLVRLGFHIPPMRTTHGIVTLRGRTLSPATRAFLGIVREVEAEIVRSEASGRPRPRAGTRRPRRGAARLP
jgi:DNA-binding transcriptional LysR family regulator